MGLRGDAIVQFDYCVGEILNTLEKLGLRENTLIILSSDNGPVVDDGYDDKAEELLNGHSLRDRYGATNIVLSKEARVFPPLSAGLREQKKA